MKQFPENSIHCWVYRSNLKPEMYLYLREEGEFEAAPKALLNAFGEASLVLDLVLHPERTLAREDVNVVMENLANHGFHLQIPPGLKPHIYAVD